MLPSTWNVSFTIMVAMLVTFGRIPKCSGSLKFASWGKRCEVPDPKGLTILDPSVECDVGRGMTCQQYTQGFLCGCSGALSYDRGSDECRRKVGSPCHIIKEKDKYDQLSFNRKCHVNAECVIYSGTLIGGKANADTQPVCLCKTGYMPTKNLDECVDPNASISLHKSHDLLLTMVTSLGLSLFYIYDYH